MKEALDMDKLKDRINHWMIDPYIIYKVDAVMREVEDAFKTALGEA